MARSLTPQPSEAARFNSRLESGRLLRGYVPLQPPLPVRVRKCSLFSLLGTLFHALFVVASLVVDAGGSNLVGLALLDAPELPLQPQGPGTAEGIPTDAIKAIFFMLAPGEKAPAPEGKRVRVTFRDGRQVAGEGAQHVAADDRAQQGGREGRIAEAAQHARDNGPGVGEILERVGRRAERCQGG